MPVRSLHSPVRTWPDAGTVDRAVRRWAEELGRSRKDVLRVGYFGSYARGDWGVGSDLDVVVVVETAEQPFERRGVQWDATGLPVPADLLVYTQEEWDRLGREGGRLYRTIMQEGRWVWARQFEKRD